MNEVAIVTADRAVAEAIRLTGQGLKDLAFRHVATLAEVAGAGHVRALLIHVRDDVAPSGTLADFFLLRHVLLGRDLPTVGPIALLGFRPHLFGSVDQHIPSEEMVRYFPVPFDISDLLDFLASPCLPEDRLVTRLFLRMQVTDEEMAAIARNDTHGLAHFGPLVRAVELAFSRDDRAAFACTGDPVLNGRFFRNRDLAAEALLDHVTELATGTPFEKDCERLAGRLHGCLAYFRRLAEIVDVGTNNVEVAQDRWDKLLSQIRQADGLSARLKEQEWTQDLVALCRRLQAQ